ncbi:MAG TPA: DUF2971 domain-containing protein [Sedimentisphaerales bacterium]|nr:DUF2971 domain-containing protein [Sedimentisphaerales bacterium]HNU30187.1 DUF2971 domain-containing protein [Sedimentisphaerales bacterium]
MAEYKRVVDNPQSQAATPPKFLYKYRAFDEWTPSIFQNNELHFSSPDGLNDPFDSVIRFICEGSKQQRKKIWREEMVHHVHDLPRKKRQRLERERNFIAGRGDAKHIDAMKRNFSRRNMGVLCLTEKKDDILMWSHYADHHKGFCLEFKTDDAFFSEVLPVKYACNLPSVNVLANEDEGVHSLIEGRLTKAKEWAYEHEWRIIDIENGSGIRQFPARVLRGVILGCRIAAEDKSRVVEWCKARQPRPILYQAEQKEAEFGLDIVEVEY